MKKTDNELVDIALTVSAPKWATHIAVRNDGSKAEPAAWLESAEDYLDEDPAGVAKHCWAGSYKHCYWSFFSLSALDSIREGLK